MIPGPVTITEVDHADVEDVVRAHIALQHVAYAHIADGGHAAALWGSFDRRVADLHGQVDAQAAARASDREPDAVHLVARGERGAVVGVAAAFQGVGDWEREVFAEGWQAPAAAWCLDTLYVMPGLRGAGLGLRLMDAALPERRAAYLWVISDNVDAIRFYERNGFHPDGFAGRSGLGWGDMDMLRMVRPEPTP